MVFARFFGRQEPVDPTEADPIKERRLKIDQARLSSVHLIADILRLTSDTDKSFKDEKAPMLKVSGKPTITTETFTGADFRLVKMDRQNTDESITNDTVINRHSRGVRFRRDLSVEAFPAPFWEIDVRESGVVMLTASHDYDTQAKLKFVFMRYLESLAEGYPEAYDFGVSDLSMRRGSAPISFGLHEQHDLVVAYVPTSLVLASEEVRDYVYQQIFGDEVPERLLDVEGDFDMTSSAG